MDQNIMLGSHLLSKWFKVSKNFYRVRLIDQKIKDYTLKITVADTGENYCVIIYGAGEYTKYMEKYHIRSKKFDNLIAAQTYADELIEKVNLELLFS